MRRLVVVLGWLMITAWVLGSVGALDMSLCIAKVGNCNKECKK